MGYIYCITNKANGKKYIGQTMRTPQKRFEEHMEAAYDPISSAYYTKLSKAIRAYGENNFKLEIIKEAPNKRLNYLEREYVAVYNTYYNGYNGTKGGDSKHSGPIVDYDPWIQDKVPSKTSTDTQSSSGSSFELGCCILLIILYIFLMIITSF